MNENSTLFQKFFLVLLSSNKLCRMGTLIMTMAENSALPLYIAHTILFATKATMLATHAHMP